MTRVTQVGICVLLWAGWLAAPARAAGQDLAEVIPQDVMAYVGWAGGDDPCQLLAMAQAVVQSPFVQGRLAETGPSWQQGLDLLASWMRRPGAVALWAGDDPSAPFEHLALLIAGGAESTAQAERFADFVRTVNDGEAPTEDRIAGISFARAPLGTDAQVLWTAHAGHLVVAFSELAAERVVQRLGGQGTPLVDDPEFAASRKKVQPAGPPDWCVFVEMQPLLRQCLELDAQLASEDGGPERVMRALRLHDWKSVYMHVDRAEYGTRFSLYSHFPGGQGLARLYQQRPLSNEDLQCIPRDATWATAGNLDLVACWGEAQRILDEVSPDARSKVDGGLALAQQMLGYSLVDDLLPALGDTWVLYDAPSHGGILLTGTVLVFEARNPGGLQSMLARIVEIAAGAVAGNDIEIRQHEMRHGLHTIQYVLIGGLPVPLAPAWAFVGDRCVVGLFPQSVAVALQQADPGTRRGSVLDVDDVKAARALLPPELTAFSYADVRAGQRTWYALKQLAHAAAASISAPGTQAWDLASLPPFPEELAGVRNSVWGATSDPDGVLSRGLGSSPVALVMGGETSFATAALGASILLPSLSRARELARRASTLANLRGIGMAVHIWANDHNGEFPPDLQALLDAQLISQDMLTSRRGHPPGTPPFVYVEGQSEASDPRNVLVYESVLGDEGTSVLFVDGHSEWMKRDGFQQALDATYQRLGKRPGSAP